MRNLVCSLFLLLFLEPAFCQKPPIKFGDVPMEQLTMKVYPKDSSAEAVVLADYGVTSFEYSQVKGFRLTFDRLMRIKILTKEGLRWADFSIPLYHDMSDEEKITSLKAVTYNIENGKIAESKLKDEGKFKTKYDANTDITKITLPNVKEGSVIEIAYRVSSDFLFNFQDWEFQSSIPTVLSEYRAVIPEYFIYDRYMQGYESLTVNEHTMGQGSISITSKERSEGRLTQTNFYTDKIDYAENKYRWVAQDVPAFKSEPFMTTSKDFLSKLIFELESTNYPNQPVKHYRGTWENLNKSFLDNESFGLQISGSGFLKKVTDEVISGKTSQAEQALAIYYFVKENLAWDGSKRKYASNDLKKVWESKTGSSAEINLLLTSMLQKAGLEANPVLISTRDNGFVRTEIPIGTQFNYVIVAVKIDDKIRLLDATDRTLPIGILPERCLNGQGYIVSAANHGWVDLTPSFRSRRTTKIELTLNQEGNLNGKATLTKDGYEAQRTRQRYFSKGEKEYLTYLAADQEWQLKKSEFENMKMLSEPVKEIHEIEIAEQTQSGNGFIYLNPLFSQRIKENPFKSEQRKFPVDFGSPSEQVFTGQIIIPEQFIVEELPKPKMLLMKDNAAKFTYNLSVLGNTIFVTSQLIINKSLFIQEEYGNLREFYNQVVAKQEELIVLKKK